MTNLLFSLDANGQCRRNTVNETSTVFRQSNPHAIYQADFSAPLSLFGEFNDLGYTDCTNQMSFAY